MSANPDCTFRVSLTLPAYENIRADGTQFIVLPLHYTPEVENLVLENEAYWVVRKTGDAGQFAKQLDPRQHVAQRTTPCASVRECPLSDGHSDPAFLRKVRESWEDPEIQ